MAKLCFERYLEAKRNRQEIEAEWLRALVERYSDGAFDHLLSDVGSLNVTSTPAGALIDIEGFAESDRMLTSTGCEPAGTTPETCHGLPSGLYVVTISHPGHAPARLPVAVERGLTTDIHADLLPAEDLPAGFVWVPSGPYRTGEGPDFEEQVLPGFLIAEYPVLLRDYAQWLDELLAADPASVRPHVPWTETHGRLLHVIDGRHVFAPASPIATRAIEEVPDMPVVGIVRDSAMDYAAWLGRRMGRRVELPTSAQWEKAARGTDGRLFPWGNRFDATFCSMSRSTPGEPNLRSVGAFPNDVSPYGVRDLAGGVRDWCQEDVHAERPWAVCRGGAWHLERHDCTLTQRALVDRSTKSAGIGFRVVIPLTACGDAE